MSQNFQTPVSGQTRIGELYGVLTGALEALRSAFIGATQPASPVEGQGWIDSTSTPYRFKIYQSGQWVDFTDVLPAFQSVRRELESARGDAASLEARLDVAINPDGTLKSNAPAGSWWTAEPDAVVYASENSFLAAGDKTGIYKPKRAVRLEQNADACGYVVSSVYSGGTGKTTVTVDCTVDVGLAGVEFGQGTENAPLPELKELTRATFSADMFSIKQNGVSVSLNGHNHNGVYSPVGHYHDDRYFTEAEVDAKIDVITEMALILDVDSYRPTFTAGAWRTRALNTLYRNTTGATLASNILYLPPGNYLIDWLASAAECDYHQSRLYDVTNGAAYIGAFTRAQYSLGVDSLSHGSAYVTLTTSTGFRLEQRCSTTGVFTCATAANTFGGQYSALVRVRKLQ